MIRSIQFTFIHLDSKITVFDWLANLLIVQEKLSNSKSNNKIFLDLQFNNPTTFLLSLTYFVFSLSLLRPKANVFTFQHAPSTPFGTSGFITFTWNNPNLSWTQIPDISILKLIQGNVYKKIHDLLVDLTF